MENDCYCERCVQQADPRREVVRDIINRLSIPRTYAGDWPGDMADRILKAIDEVKNESR